MRRRGGWERVLRRVGFCGEADEESIRLTIASGWCGGGDEGGVATFTPQRAYADAAFQASRGNRCPIDTGCLAPEWWL
jgi:hypothetical protein